MELKFQNKKKDYRLFCKMFFIASPSETQWGFYKAGCGIVKNGAVSRKCKKCKYGKPRYSLDEMHETDDGISFKFSAKDTKTYYICDRRKCENCSDVCTHTSDINHAKYFEKQCGAFVEKE